MFCDICGDEIKPLDYTHLGENGRPVHAGCLDENDHMEEED